MEEAKKLKEMQQKASGKGPLRKLTNMECILCGFTDRFGVYSQWWYQEVWQEINELIQSLYLLK